MTLDDLVRVLRGGSPTMMGGAGSGSAGSSSSSSLGPGSASTGGGASHVAPIDALEGFVTGLYSEVFSAVIALINR
jgi:hypothetical protein